MVAFILAWVCAFASYLVFAGQLSLAEVVAGAVGATAAVLWWIGVSRNSNSRFAFDRQSAIAAWRACRKLPGATLSVAVVLARSLVHPVEGEIGRHFYAHGRKADPADSGRRGFGVLAASLAPDSFVLRTPIDRDEIIVHALTRSEPPADPRWPL